MGRGGWPKAVVFDLDGTLVDSAPDIADALNRARAAIGGLPLAVSAVHGMIGGGSVVLLKRALAADGLVLSDRAEAELLARFMVLYREVSAAGRGLYPGARELLDTLASRGVRLGLCTNKPEGVTQIALRALGIAERFGAIVGGRDDLPKKPHAAMLLLTLDQLGVGPNDAVMVGDSATDVGTARAAGMPVIVSAGGYSPTPARALGADAVYSSLGEIVSLIENPRWSGRK